MPPEQSGPLAITEIGDLTKPPIVYLHGFLGAGTDWCNLAESLGNGYRSILIDLPGHGRSAEVPPDLYPMPACAQAIIHRLDDLKIKRASLCAYSMGGRIAFYLLTHFPERFDRAMILSSTPGLRSEQDRETRMAHDEQLAQRLERDGIGPFLVFWYQQPLFASLADHPERLKKLVNDRLDNDPNALAHSLRAMGTGAMPNCWPLIPRISSPLCLVTGERDMKFRGIAEQTADLCRSAEHHILSGCGHAVQVEAPDAVAELARSFFS